MALELRVGTETHTFRPNGEVAVTLDGGQVSVGGHWSTQRPAGVTDGNKFYYDVNGAAQTPVEVRYDFDPSNQLMVTLRNNGGVVVSTDTLQGQILADDAVNLVYALIDSTGLPMRDAAGHPFQITVYGDLQFSQDLTKLDIHLSGGGSASILGLPGQNRIQHERNNNPNFHGDDLLRFAARTMNHLPNGSVIPKDAKIELAGQLAPGDAHDGELYFINSVTGDLNRPTLRMGLSVKLKAVAGGFICYSGPAGTTFALQLHGEHQWNNAKAQWELGLGYTNNKLAVKVNGALEVHQNGSTLTLAGKAAFESGLGLTMEIAATYTWSGGTISFKAQSQNGNYSLFLEGNFLFKNGSLHFFIKYDSNAPSMNNLQYGLSFDWEQNKPGFQQKLSFLLTGTSTGAYNIALTYEIHMQLNHGSLAVADRNVIAH